MNYFVIFSVLFGIIQAEDQGNSLYTAHQRELEVTGSVDDFVFQGNVSSSPSFRSPLIRISNGRTASDTQFPFTAELSINLKSGGLLCTGSLIASNWIVSARHCIAE